MDTMETSFHEATREGDVEKLRRLLKERPDVVASRDIDGVTPLHAAVAKGHNDVAKLLLASGAEVDAKDNRGFTPLYAALHRGQDNVAELVLANEPDVNSKANDAETPLHVAARKGFTKVAESLLAKGAEVNARDHNGETPLHWAASMGHEDVVELLLTNGAEVNAKSEDGRTPQQGAKSRGYDGTAKLLRARGAKLSAKDKQLLQRLSGGAKVNAGVSSADYWLMVPISGLVAGVAVAIAREYFSDARWFLAAALAYGFFIQTFGFNGLQKAVATIMMLSIGLEGRQIMHLFTSH